MSKQAGILTGRKSDKKSFSILDLLQHKHPLSDAVDSSHKNWAKRKENRLWKVQSDDLNSKGRVQGIFLISRALVYNFTAEVPQEHKLQGMSRGHSGISWWGKCPLWALWLSGISQQGKPPPCQPFCPPCLGAICFCQLSGKHLPAHSVRARKS